MFKMLEPSLDTIVSSDIRVHAVSVVQFTPEIVSQSMPGIGVRPGPVLAMDVSEALLTATRRQRGLLVKTGHASRGDVRLLSLLMRAGRHVAMCLADLGDPSVRACVLTSMHDMRLPLLLRSDSAALMSVSRLSDTARTTLSEAQGCRPASVEEFAGAVRQHMDCLADNSFLREHGVDALKIRSRTLLLHLPATLSFGASEDLADRTCDSTTLH